MIDKARRRQSSTRGHKKVPWRRLLAVGALVGIVVLVAVSRRNGDVSPPGDASDHGERVPEVTLSDFEGKRFSLSDYRGRPLVVNFWASWCPFCIAEMPDFEKVHRSLEGEVAFLGIDQCETCQGGTLAAAKDLARKTGVTYRLAEDPDGSVFVAFGGSSMPTTVFIDARGRVVDHVGGMLTEAQLRDRIRRLFGVGSD